MKVNELIKILSDFNPKADVKINIEGIEKDLELYGWNNGGDFDYFERNIDKRKINKFFLYHFVVVIQKKIIKI